MELTDLTANFVTRLCFNTFNLDKICRLCMRKDLNLLPLFVEDNSLSEKIMSLVPALKLCASDGLPTQICSLCLNQVNTSYNFKLQCENSDVTLRRVLDFQSSQSGDSETATVKEESDIKEDVTAESIALEPDISDDHESRDDMKAAILPETIPNNNSENEIIFADREASVQKTRTCNKLETLKKDQKSSGLKVYVLKKKNDPRYFCHECGKGFETIGDVCDHLHAGENGFSCQYCGKHFIFKCSLNSHYKLHPDKKPYSCKVCCETFTRNIALKEHRKTHVEKFMCDICGQQLNFQRNLKYHLVTHSGEKPFSCHVCGKTFAHQKNLNIHLGLHSNDKPYSCEECGMCFKQRKTLSNHMKIHTGEQNFICVQCGKKFSRKRQMQLHMLSHTGEKPIECTECDRTFARRESLVKHMRIHTGHKPFKCETCGKAFSQSQKLRCHSATHDEIKPFMCTECGKTFARKDRLKDHLASHSGKRPFLCPLCGKGFVRKDHLKCHINSTHGQDYADKS